MRKSTIGVLMISLASLAAISASPQAGGERARNKLEGTWEHTFEDEPRLRQIKVINQDHFIWVSYVKESRLPVTTAGGTYTLEGDTYKEQVEFGRFGSPELQKTVGKEQVFKVEVDGDTLVLTGTLSNGQELHEVWRRVKR
jgi:hypothetical protein